MSGGPFTVAFVDKELEADRMTQTELTFEAWKPVVGYEARYDVSDQGNVWSIKNKKVLKPAPTRGYLTVNLCDGSSPGKRRNVYVHDLVLAAFIGPKPDGYQVDHGRRGKQCNALTNLEYVTPEENIRRAIECGLIGRGMDDKRSKLTEDGVRQLRALRASGMCRGLRRLAIQFGVSEEAARRAAYGRSYKNVI